MKKCKQCKKCDKVLGKKNKYGFCNKCRDRTGKNNSMFGRSVHTAWIEKYGKEKADELLEKQKIKWSISSKKNWQNEEYRKKVISGTSKPRKESFKKEQSERITQWYKDNPEQRKIRSLAMKKSWEDGKIKLNINSINESKIERNLREKVENFTNLRVRKKTIRIDKRWFYPDILIEDDFIIEFYGNFWHANPEMYEGSDFIHHNRTAKDIWEHDKERIDILIKNGYSVIIVWEKDYKTNPELVLNNLKLEIENYGKEKDNQKAV